MNIKTFSINFEIDKRKRLRCELSLNIPWKQNKIHSTK